MTLGAEILPGTVITEAELVRRVGMSRTPVREALRRLEGEGYLRALPGRGYVVIELSEQDMINVYRVRASLEGLAAQLAAGLVTRLDLARLEDLYDAMADAVRRDDDDELAQLNSQFHGAIAEASGNAYLRTMLDNIHDVFERFRMTALAQPGRRSDAHGEHGELIAALREHDAELAREIAEGHVHRALKLRRSMAKQDAPKEAP
jgi:DNA-binding GntR family transcriptional regulator